MLPIGNYLLALQLCINSLSADVLHGSVRRNYHMLLILERLERVVPESHA